MYAIRSYYAADVTAEQDLEKLVDESMAKLGGKLDFILHSVGMSLNIRKGNDYPDLNYEFMKKTLDISAISLHRLLQVCMKKDARITSYNVCYTKLLRHKNTIDW